MHSATHHHGHGLYAAGILPYTLYNGDVYFLLGKDARDNCWSDFGGKAEQEDENRPLNTAIREMYEETCGVVMDLRCLRGRLTGRNERRHLVSQTQNNKDYYMYCLEIPFNPLLRSTFRKVLSYLKYMKVHKKSIEKTDVKWISASAILQGDIRLRCVFQNSFKRWWRLYGHELIRLGKQLAEPEKYPTNLQIFNNRYPYKDGHDLGHE